MANTTASDHENLIRAVKCLYGTSYLLTQFVSSARCDVGINRAGDIHRDCLYLPPADLLRPADNKLIGNRKGMIDDKRTRHSPVKAVFGSMRCDMRSELFMVIDLLLCKAW